MAACVLAIVPAKAQWSDNFDSYTLGSINGQGGWEGWTGNAAAAGTVTAAQASSLPNSLRVVVGNDTVQPFTGYVGGLWTLSLQQYIPSSSSGATWTILMNQYPNNLNWSAEVYANLTEGWIGVLDGDGNQYGSTPPLVKDQWVDMRFDINLDGDVSAYYNNTLIGTFPWQVSGGSINQLQALDLYPDEGANTAQVGAVYYDNLSLQAVPEPTTIALAGLGFAALMIFRRRN